MNKLGTAFLIAVIAVGTAIALEYRDGKMSKEAYAASWHKPANFSTVNQLMLDDCLHRHLHAATLNLPMPFLDEPKLVQVLNTTDKGEPVIAISYGAPGWTLSETNRRPPMGLGKQTAICLYKADSYAFTYGAFSSNGEWKDLQ